ncbi:MAG: hypothetical protein R3F43_30855 [bacterium]
MRARGWPSRWGGSTGLLTPDAIQAAGFDPTAPRLKALHWVVERLYGIPGTAPSTWGLRAVDAAGRRDRARRAGGDGRADDHPVGQG